VETTECTNTGHHEPHDWRGKRCLGRGPVAALTLPQIEGIAAALGLDFRQLAFSIADALREGRVR
jgi:hypothetical protein